MKGLLAITLITLSLVASLLAQPKIEPSSDFLNTLHKANQGHSWSQYEIGVMYSKGEEVPKSDAEAAKWYRLAAVHGVVQAQTQLGDMLLKGEGVAKDELEAVKWFRAAALKGDPWGKWNLSLMYAGGSGETKKEMEAQKWYINARFKDIESAIAAVKADSVTAADVKATRLQLIRESMPAKITLEVSQVHHRWEVVVRLHDDIAHTRDLQCRVYRILEDGKKVKELHLADLRLDRTKEAGEFIGIYSNGKELPHGTKVLVRYYPKSRKGPPVDASTTMAYH